MPLDGSKLVISALALLAWSGVAYADAQSPCQCRIQLKSIRYIGTSADIGGQWAFDFPELACGRTNGVNNGPQKAAFRYVQNGVFLGQRCGTKNNPLNPFPLAWRAIPNDVPVTDFDPTLQGDQMMVLLPGMPTGVLKRDGGPITVPYALSAHVTECDPEANAPQKRTDFVGDGWALTDEIWPTGRGDANDEAAVGLHGTLQFQNEFADCSGNTTRLVTIDVEELLRSRIERRFDKNGKPLVPQPVLPQLIRDNQGNGPGTAKLELVFDISLDP